MIKYVKNTSWEKEYVEIFKKYLKMIKDITSNSETKRANPFLDPTFFTQDDVLNKTPKFGPPLMKHPV